MSTLLDTFQRMNATAQDISALSFHQPLPLTNAAICPEQSFERNLIREAEPQEKALFQLQGPTNSFADASVESQRVGPKRVGLGTNLATPLRPGADRHSKEPKRALDAAKKLLEIYHFPRAQDHVDSLYNIYNGLNKVIMDLEQTLAQPLSQYGGTSELSEEQERLHAEREQEIKNEEMEIIALKQLAAEKTIEVQNLKRKSEQLLAKRNAAKKISASKDTVESRKVPPRSRPSVFLSPTIEKTQALVRAVPVSTEPSLSQEASTVTKPAESLKQSSKETVKEAAEEAVKEVVQPVRPPSVPHEVMESFSTKIWSILGDTLRPWSTSKQENPTFAETQETITKILACPVSVAQSPVSSLAFSNVTNEQDPLPPTASTKMEYYLLDTMLSTFTGSQRDGLSIVFRDALMPTETGPKQEPMISLNKMKSFLGKYVVEKQLGGSELVTSSIYALVGKGLLRIDRRGGEAMLGFRD